MKRIALAAAGFLSLVVVLSLTRDTRNLSSHASGEASRLGVFSGTTPCDEFVKSFLRIPVDEKCDRIKWELNLYRNTKTGAPMIYQLTREFGYHIDNRTYKSIDSTNLEGNWRITKGRQTDPDAVIFQLDAGKSNGLAFVQVDHNLLHPLDANTNLLPGNDGHSYTLSRTDKTMNVTNPPAKPTAATNHAPAVESNVTANTVFAGRTPCRELARDLNLTVEPNCMKLKWKLTFRRDPKTLFPTTYELKSTLTQHQVSEGKWRVVRGTKTNPNAIVYQLDAGGLGEPISLLKADDGVLFFLGRDGGFLIGNEDFSYTLNRSS